MAIKYIAQENQSDTNVSPGTYEFTKQLLLTPNGLAFLGLTIPAYTSKRYAWLTRQNEPATPITNNTNTVNVLIGEITVISDPSMIELAIVLRRTNSTGVIQLSRPVFPPTQLITKNAVFSTAILWPTDTWNSTDRLSVTAWGPMSIEPHHPDLFWYGIHGCEILYTVMGKGCKTVTRESQEKVVGVWADGRTGIFEGRKGYGAEVVGTKGKVTVGKFEGYKPMVIEICKSFKTGKPPVSMEETLEIYTFMEAADESKKQAGAPVKLVVASPGKPAKMGANR